MLVKTYKYVCRGCGETCREDMEILPEWEADYDQEELKKLSEIEYCVKDAWCRECAERENYIFFDSNHPVVKYTNQRKQYKLVVKEVFKEVTQRFLEDITDEILWQLNKDAFNYFATETKCGKKKAAKVYCRDAEKQIKEYIVEEIYRNQKVKEEKSKLELLNREIVDLLREYPREVWGLISLEACKDDVPTVYSKNPDDFFVWSENEHIGGRMKKLVDTEDKINGNLWNIFFMDLAAAISG